MLDANFWQDKSASQKIIKEKKFQEDLVNSYENSVKSLKDLDELHKLAIDEKNQTIVDEVLDNVKKLKVVTT